MQRVISASVLGLACLATLYFGGMPVAADVVFTTTTIRPNLINGRVYGMATAIDAHNRPHVMFSETYEPEPDQDARRVVYGHLGQSGWEFETIAADSWISGDHGLAVDALGNPHVAMTNRNTHDLIYGTRGPDGWEFESMGLADSWTPPAIEIDQDQRPAIAHFSFEPSGTAGVPVLTIRNGRGHWNDVPMLVTPVIRDWSNQIDLVFDASGSPHIAYTGYTDWGGPGFVSLASPDPLFEGAMTENRLYVGYWDDTYFDTASVLAEPAGGVRVVSMSTSGRHGELVHFSVNQREATGGVIHRVTIPSYPSKSTLTVGPDGRSRLVYSIDSDRSGDQFHLVISQPDGEIVDTVDLSGLGDGWYPSIVSDQDGGIHLFYQGFDGINYSYVPEPLGLTTLLVSCGVLVLRRP